MLHIASHFAVWKGLLLHMHNHQKMENQWPPVIPSSASPANYFSAWLAGFFIQHRKIIRPKDNKYLCGLVKHFIALPCIVHNGVKESMYYYILIIILDLKVLKIFALFGKRIYMILSSLMSSKTKWVKQKGIGLNVFISEIFSSHFTVSS